MIVGTCRRKREGDKREAANEASRHSASFLLMQVTRSDAQAAFISRSRKSAFTHRHINLKLDKLWWSKYFVSSDCATRRMWSTTGLQAAALQQLVKLWSESASYSVSGLLKQFQTNSNLFLQKMHAFCKTGK